jgi:uncharacterized secreted protein with C-terminal beta-propeller domain
MSRQGPDQIGQQVRKSSQQRQLGALEQLETRCLLNARRVWTIAGDQNPQDLADTIVIDRDPAQTANLRAIVNGEVVGTRPERKVSGIRIFAGQGSDTVAVDESLGTISVPVTVAAGTGDDAVTGGSGRDSLDGGDGVDSLSGGAGRDHLRGGNGANRLEGGDGADELWGGQENDTMWGGAGDDRLHGLGGRDRMHGGDGRDTILGGLGNDTLVAQGSDPAGGAPAPTIQAATSRARGTKARYDDVLDGGTGDNVLVGDERDLLQNGRAPETLDHLASCTDVGNRLREQAQRQYGWYTGGGWGGSGGGIFLPLDLTRIETFAAGLSSAGSVTNSTTADPTFSGTNTQEQGVDEADIVKTDGNFVYVLRAGELIIVDALPAEDASVVSRTEIEGSPIDMFLHGDRLMIFSIVHSEFPILEPVEPAIEPVLAARLSMPFWWGGKSEVKITVLSVTDPASPELVHESFLDGSYINARMVDGKVYLVMNNAPRLPIPWITDVDGIIEVESPEHFQERLAAVDPNSLLPQYRSIDYSDSGTTEQTGDLLIDCSGVYKTPIDDWMNLTTVLSFDLNAETIGGPTDSATVFGTISTVYASAQSLYLVNHAWHGGESASGIHKLSLGDDIRVEASGEVPGLVLNQFSLDEEGAYFRVATTINSWDPQTGGTSANAVFVMAQEGDTLNVVGSLEDLAPGERIFAARFFDDHGFVVTFRQVDPLFALDLTDPTDPKVAGELKVSGFSRYLHPIDETHLLAIGRDADETGRVRGLQVSLFDVSDLNNPSLVDQYLIQPEGGWSWSAAEWDHHAFAYFAESGIMSIPVEGSVQVVQDGAVSQWQHQSEFWVFQVNLTNGFELLGEVGHDSTALRSLRVNDRLYTLAYDDIKIQPLVDPTATTNEVSLE